MKQNMKNWLRAAGIRALKTFAQSAAAALSVGAATGVSDLRAILTTSAIAAALSLLTSCAGLPEVDNK
ncbi:MAG: hypothetical protein IJU51_06810 [Clostridia bacterium]|nr:hypothetical protein [Clostridia bacterium]